jgi:hypothetical protein
MHQLWLSERRSTPQVVKMLLPLQRVALQWMCSLVAMWLLMCLLPQIMTVLL